MRSENGRESQAKSPAAPKIQMAMARTIEMPTMRPARRDCCLSRVLSPESVIPRSTRPTLAQVRDHHPYIADASVAWVVERLSSGLRLTSRPALIGNWYQLGPIRRH